MVCLSNNEICVGNRNLSGSKYMQSVQKSRMGYWVRAIGRCGFIVIRFVNGRFRVHYVSNMDNKQFTYCIIKWLCYGLIYT